MNSGATKQKIIRVYMHTFTHLMQSNNLHCTMMLTFLSSLLMLLLAEHMYSPVLSLMAFVIVKFTLTLVTFPYPVGTLTLSLTDTLSLESSLLLLHMTVGGGYPSASHRTVALFVSLIITPSNTLTTSVSPKNTPFKVTV